MLRPEAELYALLTRTIRAKQTQIDELKRVTDALVTKYDCDLTTVSDVLTMRRSPDQVGIPLLFLLLQEFKPAAVKDFFTVKEIKEYSSAKTVKRKRLHFPLTFNVVEIVKDSQWIGKITVQQLMLIRDAQKIYYDPNAQRPMKYVENGKESYYKIATNESAIHSIQQSYHDGVYIPDTITLNMPDDAEFEYEDGVLTISQLDHFDIADGYHRYVAMNRESNENPDFDYPMELRITRFPLEKTRQFIWQADQKTKMKKYESDSFNQEDMANQVVTELKSMSVTRDFIGADKKIQEAPLALMIRVKYFLNTQKHKFARKEIIAVRNEIHDALKNFIDDNLEFDRKWEEWEIYAWFYLALEKGEATGSDVSALATKLHTAISNNELRVNSLSRKLLQAIGRYE